MPGTFCAWPKELRPDPVTYVVSRSIAVVVDIAVSHPDWSSAFTPTYLGFRPVENINTTSLSVDVHFSLCCSMEGQATCLNCLLRACLPVGKAQGHKEGIWQQGGWQSLCRHGHRRHARYHGEYYQNCWCPLVYLAGSSKLQPSRGKRPAQSELPLTDTVVGAALGDLTAGSRGRHSISRLQHT